MTRLLLSIVLMVLAWAVVKANTAQQPQQPADSIYTGFDVTQP